MCIILTTTYIRCWGEYTHTLLCSTQFERSPLRYDRRQDHSISALNCHDLGYAHLQLDHAGCLCKTHPVADTIEVKCERFWGGEFWDVLAPGEQVDWYGREWVNCTNLVVLQKHGDRYLTPEQQKIVRERDWYEGEWTGKGQRVDWRKTDWVAKAETCKYRRMEKQRLFTAEMKTESAVPFTADDGDALGIEADRARNMIDKSIANHRRWLETERKIADTMTADLTTTNGYDKRSDSSSETNPPGLPTPDSERQITPSMTVDYSKENDLMTDITMGNGPPLVTEQCASDSDSSREQIEEWMAEIAGLTEKDVAHSVAPMNAKERRKMRRSKLGNPTPPQGQSPGFKLNRSKKSKRKELARLEKEANQDIPGSAQEDGISMVDDCATNGPFRSGMSAVEPFLSFSYKN
jgi:hypothetical protein